jgi:hypothetical protein
VIIVALKWEVVSNTDDDEERMHRRILNIISGIICAQRNIVSGIICAQQKRPTIEAKETYYRGKRDLL